MATIRKQKVKQYTYWQIIESKRVDGKPRPVVLAHLGTAEQLLDKLTSGPVTHTIQSVSHGAVQVLHQAALFLDLPSIFFRCFSSHQRDGLTVGESLLAAAIHRAVHPGSKRAFGFWAQQTSLLQLLNFDPQALDSPHFWDQMDRVSETQLQAAEQAVTEKMVRLGIISPPLLYYDLTNFFPYICSTNTRTELTQRGHNKQKRMDLRQFRLAQVVTEDFLLPVYSSVYAGDAHDSTRFLPFLTQLRTQLAHLQWDLHDITLVFDKGSNSKKNFAQLDQQEFAYVGSLQVSYYPDLLAIEQCEYHPVRVGSDEVLCYRTAREIWGAQRTVVLYISEQLRAGQIRGLVKTLQNPRAKKRIREKLETHIQELLKQEKVEGVLRVDLQEHEPGRSTLSWSLDEQAYEQITGNLFGKRMLVTSRSDWTTERIISAYSGQYHGERVFRQLKNPYHTSMRPQYHWTDQKIRVHTFICIMGLLLSQLVYKQATAHGYTGGLDHLLDQLGTIRKAEIVTSIQLKAKPVKTQQLEHMEPELQQLYEQLLRSFEQ